MDAHNNIINSNNHNPYINVKPIPNSPANNKSSSAMNSIYDVLNRCGKSVEKATKQAEDMADNFWKHMKILSAHHCDEHWNWFHYRMEQGTNEGDTPHLVCVRPPKNHGFRIPFPQIETKLLSHTYRVNLRLGSHPADAAMAKLVQGTKVLTYGGYERVFENTFGILQGEKLLKQYACYISTSNGPITGTLYISTTRLAFCSDYPFYYYPVSPHNSQAVYYKVVVPLEKLSRVSPCSNRWNPLEKYIVIVTVDGCEFTFMGFIAYDKAFKTLSEASQRCRNHSTTT